MSILHLLTGLVLDARGISKSYGAAPGGCGGGGSEEELVLSHLRGIAKVIKTFSLRSIGLSFV